jgi:hypothetical protein
LPCGLIVRAFIAFFTAAAIAEIDTATLPVPTARAIDLVKDVQSIFAASWYSCHGEEEDKSAYRLT